MIGYVVTCSLVYLITAVVLNKTGANPMLNLTLPKVQHTLRNEEMIWITNITTNWWYMTLALICVLLAVIGLVTMLACYGCTYKKPKRKRYRRRRKKYLDKIYTSESERKSANSGSGTRTKKTTKNGDDESSSNKTGDQKSNSGSGGARNKNSHKEEKTAKIKMRKSKRPIMETEEML